MLRRCVLNSVAALLMCCSLGKGQVDDNEPPWLGPELIAHPNFRESVSIPVNRWEALAAKVDVSLGVRPHCRLEPLYSGRTQYFEEVDSELKMRFDYYFWILECSDLTEELLEDLARTVIYQLTQNMPDLHMSVHCIVVKYSSDGVSKKRYITFDTDQSGNLQGPNIHVTYPEPVIERRQALRKLYAEMSKIEKELDRNQIDYTVRLLHPSKRSNGLSDAVLKKLDRWTELNHVLDGQEVLRRHSTSGTGK